MKPLFGTGEFLLARRTNPFSHHGLDASPELVHDSFSDLQGAGGPRRRIVSEGGGLKRSMFTTVVNSKSLVQQYKRSRDSIINLPQGNHSQNSHLWCLLMDAHDHMATLGHHDQAGHVPHVLVQ